MEKTTLTNNEYKVLLEQLNISQKEFALRIGISENTAKSWFTKKTMPYWAQLILEQMYELEKYKKIADGLKAIGAIINNSPR